MTLLRVGGPYVPGKSKLTSGTNYNFRGGQHELLLLLSGLTQGEIDGVRHGRCRFGIVVHRRVVFFLYKLEGFGGWCDAPYSIWMLPEKERVEPEQTGPESRALLQIILVDADHNRIEALRAISIPPNITAALHTAIREQLAEPISIDDYDAAIRNAYARWPDTESMAAAGVTGRGGE